MTFKGTSKKQTYVFMTTMMSIDIILDIIVDIKTWVCFFPCHLKSVPFDINKFWFLKVLILFLSNAFVNILS